MGLEAKCTSLQEELVAAKSTGPEATMKGACQQTHKRSEPTLNTWTAFPDGGRHVAAENVLPPCFSLSFTAFFLSSRSLFPLLGPGPVTLL